MNIKKSYFSIAAVMIGLFLFSGCATEGQLKPWTSTTLRQTEFSFGDVDMDKGEVGGDITLKVASSLKLTGVDKYVIYWSVSRDKADKGSELTQVSAKSAKEVLYTVKQDTALPSTDVNYFLLYLMDGKGKEVFSGKSARVMDKFKEVKEKDPVVKPDPTSDVDEPPKPDVDPLKPGDDPVTSNDPGKPLIIMIENVLFEYDRSSLTREYKSELKTTLGKQDKKDQMKLLVVGHADERGSNEYNLALGERRAYAVKRYLIRLGFMAKNVKVISYGEEKPLDADHNEAAWAKNRRAESNVVD